MRRQGPFVERIPPFDLMVITDPQAPLGLCGAVTAALEKPIPRGRIAIQLRAKGWPTQALLNAGGTLRALTAAHQIPLLVNGRPALARTLGADGVHLPEAAERAEDARATLAPSAWVGRSCHDRAGLLRAGAADYATLSPYFTVPGKAAPLCPKLARALCQQAPVPVFALGGIEPGNVAQALASGATGVAVIRAVLYADRPANALLAILTALDRARSETML